MDDDAMQRLFMENTRTTMAALTLWVGGDEDGACEAILSMGQLGVGALFGLVLSLMQYAGEVQGVSLEAMLEHVALSVAAAESA